MKWLRPIGKRALRTGAGVALGAFVLTTILSQIDFGLLEATLYDLRMAMGYQKAPSSEIALISIDDTSAKELDELIPLSMRRHADLMEVLEKMNPKGIGYIANLNRANDLALDRADAQAATRFVEIADRLEMRGVPVLLGTQFDVNGEVVPPYPLSAIHHSVAVLHKDGNIFAEDKVTRRALTYLYDKPVFHIELAQRLGRVPEGFHPRGSFSIPEIEAQYFFFRYHGNVAKDPRGKRPSLYPTYSAASVLRGEVPPEAFDGKIVLVGTVSREDSNDFAFTPYSKTAFQNPKLAIHAAVLDSVLRDDGIVRAAPIANAVATFGVTAAVISWVLRLTPLYGVMATFGLAILYVCVAQFLFSFQGLWIRESQPLVGIFLGYYLVVPYRLIREYKQRWDYQQKHELLVQVEELKTNFVSLVTHDLKTPVARIQGLAEVLLRKARERLIPRDIETIDSIIAATDELNRFISSILELNKVDSNRLQLKMQSKDVNQIIEKAVETFRPATKARHISLSMQLEPLFPIRIDIDLVGKMVNNLIDNAIKYSPRDSTIEVISREIENQWVEISVKDQGIGMTEEELANLFTRFYRAKNDATVQSPGTGLGLYLTKYFAEAMGGRVEVTSQPEAGSTFKILLPLDAAAAAPQGLTTQVRSEETYVQNSSR